MTIERCAICDEPTGRAGRGEDSLFVEDKGPFCSGCFEDICGLCGEPGADKIPHPVYWPGERQPETDHVHASCEAAECARAHAELSDKQRADFLRTI